MKTLVDCGCEARVHPDGSGVEIDYCPQHEAAPKMYEALAQFRDAPPPCMVNSLNAAPVTSRHGPCDCCVCEMQRAVLAALAKADGKVAP